VRTLQPKQKITGALVITHSDEQPMNKNVQKDERGFFLRAKYIFATDSAFSSKNKQYTALFSSVSR